MRTWLFAEEKALKVLDHGHRVKIRAMDVHHAEAGSLVVTGADDGGLRAWRTKRNEGEEEAAALEWKVSRAHSHQVLVVTHLPQVAAFADRHLVVAKDTGGAVTTSGVRVVEDTERARELARMLAGLPDSDLGIAHAEELLAVAAKERRL